MPAIPILSIPDGAIPSLGVPGVSTESVLEMLAQWHLDTINEITEANGYCQTLTGSRSTDLFHAGESVDDLATLCRLGIDPGSCVKEMETLDADCPKITWVQRFDAIVHILGERDGLTEDQRITRIVADIQTRMGEERQNLRANYGRCCEGLASMLEILAYQIGESDTQHCTVVNVPVAIWYTVHANDPRIVITE